jgi:hypothetical protein
MVGMDPRQSGHACSYIDAHETGAADKIVRGADRGASPESDSPNPPLVLREHEAGERGDLTPPPPKSRPLVRRVRRPSQSCAPTERGPSLRNLCYAQM